MKDLSKAYLLIGRLLILVGVAPLFFFVLRGIVSPLDTPRPLSLTLAHGTYTSPLVRVDGDSEYRFWATLYPVSGAQTERCPDEMASQECQAAERVLKLEEELDLVNYLGGVIQKDVYERQLVVGRRVEIHELSAGRGLFPQRLRINLRVLEHGKTYSGASPRLEIAIERDPEGTAFEVVPIGAWAVIIAGIGAIVLRVGKILRRHQL